MILAKIVIKVVKTNFRYTMSGDLFCWSCCGVCCGEKLIDLIFANFSAD